MMFLKKICIGALALSVLGLHFPKITLAAQSRYFAKAATITKHAPEILASPEEKIPGEEVPIEKRGTWLWTLGSAVLVGIIAAAGGGGGGGGGGDTGDVTVEW